MFSQLAIRLFLETRHHARTCLQRAGQPCGDQEVDDLLQGAVLRLLRRFAARGPLPPSQAVAYFRTIVRNLAIDGARRARSFALDDHDPAAPDETPAAWDGTLVREALAALALKSPRSAALLRDHYFAGVPYARLAAAHGISEDAVAQRLRRARSAFARVYLALDTVAL